jgi:hypothetical protein
VLDYAVYQFPEFNNFNRWAAHNTDPKDRTCTRRRSTRFGRAWMPARVR